MSHSFTTDLEAFTMLMGQNITRSEIDSMILQDIYDMADDFDIEHDSPLVEAAIDYLAVRNW